MEMTRRMPEWKANLVSVIMPAHNSQALLEESARSVIAQTYPDWELLIVDDASTDGTLKTARELALADPRIRIVPLTRNVGVAAARNRGIAAARGQYIAFLDSDDLWLSHKLKTQIEFMRKSGAAFSFAEYRRFNGNGMLSKPIKVPSRTGYEKLLRGNLIGCLTVVIDRFTIGEVSMPSIKHEDYVTWLGILKQGHVAWGIHEDLARYRLTSTSVSADKKRAAGWTWNIYRRIEGLSIAKSIWCFANYFLHAIYVRCTH
jgi:glycosyltransferase involved in cell wall biosynthesis